MSSESIVDLDELVIKCRNQAAKEYIKEAVACYKSGAYRACIVATWIAFTFDFLSKINELNLSGDAKANAIINEFERIIQNNDIVASLKFEKDILRLTKEFELLNEREYQEMYRLYEDRNMCAHPSMIALEEPYRPSAELARCHLRNAVIYFLQRPPVQGKAALDRLLGEVESEYFPVDYKIAEIYFRSGPLARAKESLVNNFISVLVKALLLEERHHTWRIKRKSAIQAVYAIYPMETEQFLKAKFSIIVQRVTDKNWDYLLEFLFIMPNAWVFLGEDLREKLKNYVGQTNLPYDLAYAVKIEELRPLVTFKISSLRAKELGDFIRISPIVDVTEVAISYFGSSQSYASSFDNFSNLILPLHAVLTVEQIKKILIAFVNNRQIYESGGMDSLYKKFFDLTQKFFAELKIEWKAIYQYFISHEYGEELTDVLKLQYPEFVEQ